MATSPIYADYVMPQRADDFFRWFSLEADPRWEDGNVECGTGWFALLKPDRADIAKYVSEFGEPWVSSGHNVPAYTWYLYQVDNNGIVWVHSYAGLDGLRPDADQRRRALADFNRLRREYTRWADTEIEEIMTLLNSNPWGGE